MDPYTGAITGSVSGSFTAFAPGFGTITCNESSFTGSVAAQGTSSTPAPGSVSALDATNSGGQACPDDIGVADHSNFTALDLPWSASFAWSDGNTTGSPNGTVVVSGVRLQADFGIVSCVFAGNHNSTGGTTRQLDLDFYNPSNTTSGDSELRFVNEPFSLVTGSGCPASASVTATYIVATQGGADVVLTSTPPAPPTPPACSDDSDSTDFETALPIALACTSTSAPVYSVLSGPDDGVISGDVADGSFTYTPDDGFAGQDSFTFQATNDVGPSEIKTFTITVDPPAAPTCQNVSASTPFQTAVDLALNCTGAGTLSYEVVTNPTNGVILLDPADGAVTYTPNGGFSGADTFTYRAGNQGGDSATRTVTVTVGTPPASPQPPSGSTGTKGSKRAKKCKKAKKRASAAKKRCKKK